ncbi:bifunctional DNA primase/polymerase [Mycobacterium sp. MBM]|nr:bifunctional DNA primase/polymerase [Mycobacterium sp. MBM]
MTQTEDRPGDVSNTGPESEAQLPAGAAADDTQPCGLRYLDEGQRQFVTDLDALAVPVWVEHPRTDGRDEFRRPRGWQDAWAEHNNIRLGGFEPGMCLCANTGGRLLVVDVDPRNGGDIEAVRQWLTGLNVRVFADVITPSGGRHLYTDGAWREDIHTVHGKLPSLPGVDLQAKGANVFVPGTRRPKYDGKGYEIVVNELAAIRSEGDPDGAANLAAWLAEHAPKRAASAPGQPWNGTPLDTRQRAYLDAVLTNSVREVTEAVEGTRNDTLNSAAFTLGAFVTGAGLDCGRAESALLDAADRCGLSRDEAETTVTSGMTAGMDNPRAVPLGEDQELRDPFGCRARRTAGADSSAAMSTADTVDAETAFWAQRDVLAQLLAFSRSRGVAPYAVLGAVLRRAITHVAPSVQLPPTVGDAVSVNLFTVSVGRSGQGKDAANGVGRAAVEFITADGVVLDDPPSAVGLGSGEGFAKALRPTGDDGATPAQVHLQVPEIGTLGALADRKGGTLIGELLKAYMGQPLGFTNAQATTTSYVPAHTYRLCLGVGAQPENANVFMEREKDGLPQRFLWLPTVDPYAPPPTAQSVEPVPAARVVLPTFPTVIPGTPHMVRTPSSVQEAIRMHRHGVLTGDTEVDPLDSHLMLTRLKVAFALALIDGHANVTDDDWRVAGQLIEVSNRVRTDLKRQLADRRKRDNRAKAHAQADRQQIIDERQGEDRHTRVWKAIVRKLSKVQAATRRDLQRACDSTVARDFPAVFDSAVDQGKLVTEGEGNARIYRLSEA